jgi:hypothetical protein
MPAPVVVAVVVTPVSISMSLTVAEGITAPDVSVTTPVTAPRTPCALSALGNRSNRKASPGSMHRLIRRMVSTSSTVPNFLNASRTTSASGKSHERSRRHSGLAPFLQHCPARSSDLGHIWQPSEKGFTANHPVSVCITGSHKCQVTEKEGIGGNVR